MFGSSLPAGGFSPVGTERSEVPLSSGDRDALIVFATAVYEQRRITDERLDAVLQAAGFTLPRQRRRAGSRMHCGAHTKASATPTRLDDSASGTQWFTTRSLKETAVPIVASIESTWVGMIGTSRASVGMRGQLASNPAWKAEHRFSINLRVADRSLSFHGQGCATPPSAVAALSPVFTSLLSEIADRADGLRLQVLDAQGHLPLILAKPRSINVTTDASGRRRVWMSCVPRVFGSATFYLDPKAQPRVTIPGDPSADYRVGDPARESVHARYTRFWSATSKADLTAVAASIEKQVLGFARGLPKEVSAAV